MQTHVTIIGAGPAGLTAAYLLAKEGVSVIVLEADPIYVGGIARTVTYKGFCFDIGGHRFFSKAKIIEDFWTEILPNDMLIRPRLSRIFYNKKFFSYPLNLLEVLRKLGLVESLLCFLSYLKSCLFPIKQPKSFADWVKNHFGSRLFNIFFKTYTEKVWGISCDLISADWAAQRIKGLSFFSAVLNVFKKKSSVKSLIHSFRYPRKGPGMLWEVCAEKFQRLNGQLILDAKVRDCYFDGKKWEVVYQNSTGELKKVVSEHVISSAPLRELVLNYVKPFFSETVRKAAEKLQYRDFLIVILILKDRQQLQDNWIYIHDPAVQVARIQNFKSWSEEMVPDPTLCCYGMEYFCFAEDGLWVTSDRELLIKAKQEIQKIGLANAEDIMDGCVIRQAKAYPVYDEQYKQNVEIIMKEITAKYPSLHLVGRNGMHKYNNQDHSMMTAMLTVQNILHKKTLYNVWEVNQDAEYHEESLNKEMLRSVPSLLS